MNDKSVMLAQMLCHSVGQVTIQMSDAAAKGALKMKMRRTILLGGYVLISMHRATCAVGLFKATEYAARAKL